eukprot:NODE_30_length_37342_cov_0.449507.p28 type:complete len:110 gc:universal NODE_30_length_37342_cov_0.449507:7669-7998(+)
MGIGSDSKGICIVFKSITSSKVWVKSPFCINSGIYVPQHNTSTKRRPRQPLHSSLYWLSPPKSPCHPLSRDMIIYSALNCSGVVFEVKTDAIFESKSSPFRSLTSQDTS